MLRVAILGARRIYQEASIALRGGRRAHPGSDFMLGDRRVCGVSADLLCPTVKTDRVRVDWPRPTTLSEKLGPRQSGLHSRGRAKGIRECRRPLADPRESLHAN